VELSRSEFNDIYRQSGVTLSQKDRDVVFTLVNIVLKAVSKKHVDVHQFIYEWIEIKHLLEND
jgi:hypothetical protein